jgi:hypothetical protein
MVFFSFAPRCNSTADLAVRPEQLSPGDSVFANQTCAAYIESEI